MQSLIDVINSTSLADLEAQRDALAQEVEDAKAERIEATRKLHLAQSRYALAQNAVLIKETLSTSDAVAGGITATITTTNGNGHGDVPAATLKIIASKPGLRPKQIYEALLAQNMSVKRNYFSTVLQRLKIRDKVTVDEGAYFPAEEKELPAG
jgi:hypothetical protein